MYWQNIAEKLEGIYLRIWPYVKENKYYIIFLGFIICLIMLVLISGRRDYLKKNWYYLVAITIAVMVTTLFIRVPLPSRGYFNFGDVVVVFAGLFLGSRGGAIAGGVGSALADIVGGYAVFSPLTFIAKGLEGLLCGVAKDSNDIANFIFPLLGVVIMVMLYFLGEMFIPVYGGIGVAISELPANMLQAIGGLIGGFGLKAIISKAITLKK